MRAAVEAWTSVMLRKLVREVSIANPLLGAPRIHGELLKLGIDIGQTSVAKYMVRRRDPPSQGWRTFLRTRALPALARPFSRRFKPLSSGDPVSPA